jgi:hypothetical protein
MGGEIKTVRRRAGRWNAGDRVGWEQRGVRRIGTIREFMRNELPHARWRAVVDTLDGVETVYLPMGRLMEA